MIELFSDISIRNAALFCLAAIAGQVLNAWRLRKRGEIESMWDRFRGSLVATWASIGANALSMVGFIATGALDSVSLAAALAMGVMSGVGVDAFVNNSERAKWTPAERKEVKAEVAAKKEP